MKTFESRIENYFEDGSALISNHMCATRSKARYAFWLQHSECLRDYKDCFPFIKVRSLGKVERGHFFGNKEKFETIAKSRQIEKSHQGMTVKVDGKIGFIVGGNDSSNIDVMFENGQIHNCHPHYKTTYYGIDGNIVYDFNNQTTP